MAGHGWPDAAGKNAARASGERMRQAVESIEVRLAGVPVPLAASVGVAVRRPCGMDLPALLRRADQALYQAKHQGRNRVVWIC